MSKKNHTESEYYTKKKLTTETWVDVGGCHFGCVNNKDKVEIAWWLGDEK